MTAPLGERPLKPWTGLLAGRHLYFDHSGQEPQLVDVAIEEGTSWVTFVDAQEEDGEVRLDARDMSGTFERVR